jgi:hypothetical protein
VVSQLDQVDAQGRWMAGDALLFRPELMEADFLPDAVPAGARLELEQVLAAPVTTLAVSATSRPFVVLSYSQYGGSVHTTFGSRSHPRPGFYSAPLADRLGGYDRMWISSGSADQREFLACLLPWLARATGSDLRVSLNAGPDVYTFDVPRGGSPGPVLAVLLKRPRAALDSLVLVERRFPPAAE